MRNNIKEFGWKARIAQKVKVTSNELIARSFYQFAS